NAEWTNGTSPLNIFNTLTNGIEGSAMASYATLSEQKRWALTHYVRKWIPEKKRQATTSEDITSVCRTMSKPE
ncbi:MAG: cytochrome c, partial [Bradymonadaceae bacterium]